MKLAGLHRVPIEKIILTIGLFLIGAVHTLIFTIFQLPENFLSGYSSLELSLFCKIILYSTAIIVALAHQAICRLFGLRKVLYFGLVCNLFGVLILLINQIQGEEGIYALIILDMILFGIALTSVVNSLVTYIILEFPKHVGFVLILLFAFFNLGPMLAPLFQLFQSTTIYITLSLLTLISLWFVHLFCFEFKSSGKIPDMKMGGGMWKQLHYRLAFFVIANITYAFAETIFSLWGYTQVAHNLGLAAADSAAPFFWIFFIFGQIVILVPLYLFSSRRVLYFLFFVIMLAAFMFPIQTTKIGFITWISVAGFGCSAVFPIFLAQIEQEVLPYVEKREILLLPSIEKSISLMFAGYFFGVGTIDIWVLIQGNSPTLPFTTDFHLAALSIAVTSLIAIFLNLSSKNRK